MVSEYFASILIFAATIVLFLIWKWTRRPHGIPPGPPVYFPVLGHFVELGRGGSAGQMATFRKWREQYGDVFSIYFGNQLVVVLNGYDTIKEAFVKNGDVFSERPRTFLTDRILDKGIVGTSGHAWKQQRKFAVEVLRDFGFGKTSLQDKIQEELVVFLDTISEENGHAYDIKKSVSTSIANVVCSIAFGHRFEHGDPRFHDLVETVEENCQLNGATSPISFFPFLQYLPGDVFKINKVMGNVEKVKSFMKEIIREHVETFDDKDIRDFTGAYIKKIKDSEGIEENNSFDYDNLVGVLIDLFVAGMETTTTTIQWLLAYIVNYPQFQERIQRELDANVGKSRLPVLQDKQNLPFTEAFILEVMRLSSIVPISLPHAPNRDAEFRGHIIPKGVILLPVFDSVFRDPKLWDDPDTFHPDRFLDKEGKVQKPEYHISFSLGRRVCLGESLARMELFLFFSAMLQRFTFLSPEGEEPPSLDGVQAFTYTPKPYKLRAVMRK